MGQYIGITMHPLIKIDINKIRDRLKKKEKSFETVTECLPVNINIIQYYFILFRINIIIILLR